VHVIIATPGRLIDMLKNKFLDPNYLKLLVIDEADQMLD
jgi:superfamily II DNA/RNA helicase